MDKSFFLSEPFTFIVGPEKKPILVHSGAVSRLSPALDILINGPMREAQTKVVIWNDLEVEDFTRFCQFVYTGNYSPPKPADLSVEDSVNKKDDLPRNTVLGSPGRIDDDDDDDDDDDGDIYFGGKKKKKKKDTNTDLDGWSFGQQERKETNLSKLRTTFESRIYYTKWSQLQDPYEIIVDNNTKQDFTPVFLGHARLYLLGDKYGIEDLTLLALYKLHKTLINFRLYETRITDVIELIRYTYDHAPPKITDPLRVLIKEYVATEIDTIGKLSSFHALLEEGGDFVSDFWKIIQLKLL